jgi:hypothetical protein
VTAVEPSGAATRLQTAFYAALGIPQGIVADPANRTLAGAVRRGGELVTLSQDDYDVWSSLLAPKSDVAFAEIASLRGWTDTEDTLRRLLDTGLAIEFRGTRARDEQLARLRPIPRGAGVGNLNGDPRVFEISGPGEPLAVDAVTVTLWWELDGATSLATAISRVARRIPETDREMLEATAVHLILRLQARGLIHLDTTYEAQEGLPWTS